MGYLFTVIIPTYNRVNSLKLALDSLVDQVFKNFEVIVSDDGSTDGTKKLVETYKDLLNIKYIWNENSGGPAKPRNIALDNSNGEWICFLDSDDRWYPNKLSSCTKVMDQADLIYHYLDYSVLGWKRIFPKKAGRDLKGDILRELIVRGNCIGNSSVILRKTIVKEVGRFNESKEFIAIEDYDYWLRVAKITNRFLFIKESLGFYNWDDPSNISKISDNRIKIEKTIFEKYINDLSKTDDKMQAKKILNYKLGRYNWQLGNRSDALALLKDAAGCRFIDFKLKAVLFFVLYRLQSFRN